MRPLLSTLLLAGSASATAMATDSTNPCSDASRTIHSWSINDFAYHASWTFSNPSHQVAGGRVNFTLGNAALDYEPECAASSTQLHDFFYGAVTYDCVIPPDSGAGRADTASFSFSRSSGELRVNQTWACDGDDGGRFVARGSGRLSLSCVDEEWRNPEWREGEVYSTRSVECTAENATVAIEQISGSTRLLEE